MSSVYFIQEGIEGPIKIGTTRDVGKRLKTLQTAHPVPLRVISTLSGGPEREKQLHRILSKHRIRGEWFHPHADVLEAAKDGIPYVAPGDRIGMADFLMEIWDSFVKMPV